MQSNFYDSRLFGLPAERMKIPVEWFTLSSWVNKEQSRGSLLSSTHRLTFPHPTAANQKPLRLVALLHAQPRPQSQTEAAAVRCAPSAARRTAQLQVL